jgi:DNA-binding NarL/FixJ family response regulator
LVLRALLNDDVRFEVVAAVSSAKEMLECLDGVDLAVIDLVLDDYDGFAAIEWLHAEDRELPVAILADVDPPYLRAEAVARGAAGYFNKTHEPASVLDGFEAIARAQPSERAGGEIRRRGPAR